MIGLIKKLCKKGVKCYLATNQEKYRTEFMIDKMGFGKVFDRVFSSADIGYKKPTKVFFETMLSQIEDSSPGEIMFFDDSAENVAAAQKFGFIAKLFTNADEFYTEIKELI